jgi:hypothetical protein
MLTLSRTRWRWAVHVGVGLYMPAFGSKRRCRTLHIGVGFKRSVLVVHAGVQLKMSLLDRTHWFGALHSGTGL